jgi:glycosyltransferase involved in cell wall biosynthesis
MTSGRRISIAHVCTIDRTATILLLPQLVALRDEGFDVAVVCAPGPALAQLEPLGIRHIPWSNATRTWSLGSDLRAFAEILRIFQRERFDLVHTHTPKPGILGRIAARLAGVPHVLNTVHGFYATPEHPLMRRGPVMAAEWIAARFGDVELYQNEEDLAWARRLRIARPGRSIHLGNGIDLRLFPADLDAAKARELREGFGIGEHDLVVGTVARLVREKGYAELFQAAARVRAQEPNVRFLVIGHLDTDKADVIGPDEVEAARADVIFAGRRTDVPDLLRLMDVFVLPSWREGLPRSAMEAAATGIPMVLTDIRGCREIVHDGVEGLLVPVRDPERLSQAILELVRDPAMRDRMGKAARTHAESTFDERRVVSTVVGVTERELARPGRWPRRRRP